MLSSQYGEDQMNQMVNQMIQTLREKINQARESCTKNGSCGNTQVEITVSGKSASDCSQQPNSPCSGGNTPGSNPGNNPGQTPEQPVEQPDQPAPNNGPSSLGNISARLQNWSQSIR